MSEFHVTLAVPVPAESVAGTSSAPVSIATGFLIASLHAAGLVTLTHTPSPMGFLNEICRRPEMEKPYILLVVGYPAEDCRVPVHGGIKKPLEKIASWL